MKGAVDLSLRETAERLIN